MPRPPNVPLLRALCSLLVGIWGNLKGSWGLLVRAGSWLRFSPKGAICLLLFLNSGVHRTLRVQVAKYRVSTRNHTIAIPKIETLDTHIWVLWTLRVMNSHELKANRYSPSMNGHGVLDADYVVVLVRPSGEDPMSRGFTKTLRLKLASNPT